MEPLPRGAGAYAAAWGAAAVLAGRRGIWPLPLVAGSFAAQQHVSLVLLGAAAIAIGLVGAARVHAGRRDRRRSSAIALGATVVLWSGPLIDLVNGRDANAARLLLDGSSDDPVGWLTAARHVGRLALPWSIAGGDALRATGTSTRTSSAAVAVLLVVALAALAVAVRSSRRRAELESGAADPPEPAGEPATARLAADVSTPVVAVALGALLLAWITVAVGFSPPLFPYLFAPLVGGLVMVTVAAVVAITRLVDTGGRSHPVVATATVAAVLVAVLGWAVAGWSSMQPIATAPLQQQIDAAVRGVVAPGEHYAVRAAGLVESVAPGEVALAVQQGGGHPRSTIFALGLPAPEAGDPVLVAAMGEPLACLLARPVAPPPVVLAPSIATGLDVGVVLASTSTERAAVAACGIGPDGP